MGARSERTHTVRADGASLVCHVRGRGPLCVVHPGGPGMHWAYLRMPLVERDLTMVYLEPAGTGGSSHRPGGEPYDLAAHARNLEAVVRELADGPVFVLGHGHGGFVAQQFAARRWDRIAGLILYATASVINEATRAAARRNLRVYATRNLPPAAAEAMIAAYDRPASRDAGEETSRLQEILPAYFADYRRRHAEFEHLHAGWQSWPRSEEDADLRGTLPLINAPTMIATGAHDFVSGPDQADTLSAGIPDARRVTFTESGHFAHLEEAERFAHLILEFTGRLSARVRTAYARTP